MTTGKNVTGTKKVWINFVPEIALPTLTEGLLARGCEVFQRQVKAGDEEGALREAKGCCAIVSGLEPWNERTLGAMRDSALRLIARFGAGYDNIDIPFAEKMGIAVTNTPGMNAIAVAEAALMHMLTASRKYLPCCDMLRDGTFKMEDTIGRDMTGKTLGIIGFGMIGKYLRQLVSGFDMKVLVFDSYRNPEFESRYQIRYVNSLEEIYRQCDFISIHVPLLPETKNMIKKESIAMMKPDVVLVNTSRGGIIDEADLYDALKKKRIRAAGLDVSSSEPIQPSNRLLALPNLAVTPHFAGSSQESLTRTENLLLKIFDAFFSGGEVENILNPRYIYSQYYNKVSTI